MLLTIQIVNYNSRRSLKECLRSIKAGLSKRLTLQVIIINNEELELELGNEFHNVPFDVEIIEARKNLGFGKAHNLGFQKARGDIVFFLNPDAKIYPDVLDQLADAFTADASLGIAGPLLIGMSGETEDEQYGNRKTPSSIIGGKFCSAPKTTRKKAFEVDWLSGGAMMIRHKLFSALDGFDANYFMYFEDVDLCLRARQRGVKIIVNPAAKVFHKGGESYKSISTKKKHYYASQNYYVRKNFGFLSSLVVKVLRYPLYFKNVHLKR